jgi:hypothetical protein
MLLRLSAGTCWGAGSATQAQFITRNSDACKRVVVRTAREQSARRAATTLSGASRPAQPLVPSPRSRRPRDDDIPRYVEVPGLRTVPEIRARPPEVSEYPPHCSMGPRSGGRGEGSCDSPPSCRFAPPPGLEAPGRSRVERCWARDSREDASARPTVAGQFAPPTPRSAEETMA